LEDPQSEYENMQVELVATRNIPRIETSGILIQEFESGSRFNVKLWVAWELIKAGLARFTDDGIASEEWTQIHYRERFQPLGRPSPLPERFYARAYLTFSRLMRDAEDDEVHREQLERLKGMFRDILEGRISKIVRLATADIAASTKALQPEEVALYYELHKVISHWRREMQSLEVR